MWRCLRANNELCDMNVREGKESRLECMWMPWCDDRPVSTTDHDTAKE